MPHLALTLTLTLTPSEADCLFAILQDEHDASAESIQMAERFGEYDDEDEHVEDLERLALIKRWLDTLRQPVI